MRLFAYAALLSAGFVLGACSGDDDPLDTPVGSNGGTSGTSGTSGSGAGTSGSSGNGPGGSAGSGGASGSAMGGASGSAMGGASGSAVGGTAGGSGGTPPGSGGSGGQSTGGSGNAAGSGGQAGGTMPTNIPTPREACPTISEGATLSFLHLDVRIVVAGESGGPGPVLFYWHGTGAFDRATSAFGAATLNAIRDQGGLVVEPVSASPNGGASADTTGNGVWFYRDFEVADEVLACAVQQLSIDTRRIYASGMSAGGLQTVAMSYARSNYLAAVVPYSGGIINGLTRTESAEPGNLFSAMIVYGGPDDRFIISFETASNAYHDDLTSKGHFTLLCNHGGGHTIPADLGASSWRFLQDHPWGTRPSPYVAGSPASFPDYCSP